MNNYERLKQKWSDEACVENLINADQNDFFVEYSDCGGWGPCSSSSRGTLSFPSPIDFIAFLRFTELPRVLAYWAGSGSSDGETDITVLCDKIDEFESVHKESIHELAKRLDGIIQSEKKISEKKLSEAVKCFNEYFTDTNPELSFTIRGTLKDYVRESDFFHNLLFPFSSEILGMETDYARAAQQFKYRLDDFLPDLNQLMDELDFENPRVRKIFNGWIEYANEMNS